MEKSFGFDVTEYNSLYKEESLVKVVLPPLKLNILWVLVFIGFHTTNIVLGLKSHFHFCGKFGGFLVFFGDVQFLRFSHLPQLSP